MRASTGTLATYLASLRGQPDPQAFVVDLFTFTTNPGPQNGPANPTSLSLYYTNADVPITYQGRVFLANSLLIDGLKFKCSVGLEVDQQQITIAARPTDTFRRRSLSAGHTQWAPRRGRDHAHAGFP